MTKLLILGAAGDMGSYALQLSATFKMYSKITIGDINEIRARKVMKEVNDPRIQFQKVDANNHVSLVEIMKDHDLVISAIGPFYYFGPKVAKAAIDAKRPLVDICDDYGPTMEILQLDTLARDADVPIFLGYGWTPGLTNILTRYGYNKLDQDSPVKCNLFWGGGAADSEGLAVVLHVLYAVTGEVPSFINNELVDVSAGGGLEKVEFPKPLGEVVVFDCGHPEPVTLPRYLKNLSECTLKGGLTPNWNNDFAATLKSLGLLKNPKIRTSIGKLVHRFEAIFEKGGGIAASSARVDLRGKIDGKDTYLMYSTPSIPMGELTGYPAAIAAKLFIEGKIGGKGIIPPESLDPSLFLKELEKVGISMVYDESGKPTTLKPPKPYKRRFLTKFLWVFLILLVGIIPLALVGLFIALLVWIF